MLCVRCNANERRSMCRIVNARACFKSFSLQFCLTLNQSSDRIAKKTRSLTTRSGGLALTLTILKVKLILEKLLRVILAF